MNEVFIVNKKTAVKYPELIAQLMYYRRFSRIAQTESREEAEAVSKYYSNRADVIYAVGGDGTVNSVLQGLVWGSAALGVIPYGTGNDFYRAINDLEGIKDVDVGQINNQYFINETSIGLDAETCAKKVELEKRMTNSKKIYYLSLLQAYLGYKNRALSVNKGAYQDYSLIAICNGNYYGGGFLVAPQAILDDGYFDIISTNLSKMQMIAQVGKLKAGAHINDPKFTISRDSDLEIDAKEPVICNYDGEIMIDDHFKIQNHKRVLKLYSNPQLINNISANKQTV